MPAQFPGGQAALVTCWPGVRRSLGGPGDDKDPAGAQRGKRRLARAIIGIYR